MLSEEKRDALCFSEKENLCSVLEKTQTNDLSNQLPVNNFSATPKFIGEDE